MIRRTIADLMSFVVAPRFMPIGIDSDVRIEPLTHYCNDSSNAAWLAAMREIESEGSITPIQSDPPPDVVMDIFTPVFLRRQAD